MSLEGTFLNGTVVFSDPPGIADGTVVEVSVKQILEKVQPPPGSTLGQRLMKLAGIANGLPEDMAEEHDHYIHGTPRRTPEVSHVI